MNDSSRSSSPGGGQTGQPDEDLTIPRAAMNKMIKELLPNVRVANEARELILNCCTEFIHLLSSESNDICNQQQKKTISADHVLSALETLGFGDFKKEAEEVLNECKDVAAKRRKQSTRLENLGIPEEELLRQQQELFAKARAAAAIQEQQQIGAFLQGGGGGTGQQPHPMTVLLPPKDSDDDEDYS
ncbi:protein Dr1 [Lepeophtheirus salmonis]|uniref:Protein Dr1 n=1 Tax=Lepeophtheirus salmonis TaxID=72036 RepID=C1BVM2_LEPSM|nr:protein Dr1-like [Lepeophtheirus salmonis]ACO13075.1 Dr1 [Lepeophtheirus salmonis]ADD37902.1 Protein Dr1 [Lepeophtheirus salmonis]